MRGIKRYISRDWVWIVAGLILTEVFVKVAYTERGYLAYGGEWLTLPLMLMLAEVERSVGDVIRFLFGKKEEKRNGRKSSTRAED